MYIMEFSVIEKAGYYLRFRGLLFIFSDRVSKAIVHKALSLCLNSL